MEFLIEGDGEGMWRWRAYSNGKPIARAACWFPDVDEAEDDANEFADAIALLREAQVAA